MKVYICHSISWIVNGINYRLSTIILLNYYILNADIRRLHTDFRRFLEDVHLREFAFDLRKSALTTIILWSYHRL
jgi:hypothetical protein